MQPPWSSASASSPPYLLVGRWAYTDALADLARTMDAGSVRLLVLNHAVGRSLQRVHCSAA